MTAVDVTAVEDGIRAVTDDELAFYREYGWAKLEGLFSDELVTRLRGQIQQTFEMLPDVDMYGRTKLKALNLRWCNETARAVACSRAMGRAAATLIETRRVRLWGDGLFMKPANMGEQEVGTYWHQDYPAMPFDRALGCSFWTALVEITPEMGSLQHLDRSHHCPPLGRTWGPDAPNGAVDAYPWLLDQYSISPPLHLEAGDVLVHHMMTMHYAAPNTTDRERWAWVMHYFGDDARYNGLLREDVPPGMLTLDEPMDHPRFPLVAE